MMVHPRYYDGEPRYRIVYVLGSIYLNGVISVSVGALRRNYSVVTTELVVP